MGFFDKLFSTINKTADASQGSATPAVSKTSKPRKPRAKKPKVEEPVVEQSTVEEPKVEAPKKEEPRVSVVGFEFDPQNPSMGSMELDWNAEFIEMLRNSGYRGVNPEDIIDQWLNDVARNILRSNEIGRAHV